MPKLYKILVISLITLISISSKSQYLESNPSVKQRIFFGGDLGFSFGTSTYISVNPIIGYRITNRLSSGLGINYTYAKSNYYNFVGNMYGANVFASFTVVKNLGSVINFYEGSGILLYGEYNVMNISHYYKPLGREINYVYSPMLGVAFQSPISYRSYLLVMLLFNFNETSFSPYPNPVFKFSYQF